MIVALTGSNSLVLNRRLGQLTDEFIKKHGDLAVEKLDASEVEPAKMLEAVQSLPFLAERKMVILKGLSSNKPAAEQVEQIIDSVGPQIDLLIVEPAPDKRTIYHKTLAKKTSLEAFEEVDARDLPKWLVAEATNLGGKLSQADAAYLVDRVGASQQLLSNELTKLITCNSAVDRQTIDLLTEPTPQAKIFDLLDAAFGGNKSRTLELYAEQRAQKVEPQMILAMVAWQLRVLAALKLGSGQPVAKDFGINPYVLSKTSRLASQISNDELKRLIEQALEIDYRSKTSSFDLGEALQNYLITIS